jgi:3-methyladenine DNA glycosylase/8-oxoguanine DNA glycosylase
MSEKTNQGGVRTTHLTLHPTPPFNFEYTAYSHGWVLLLPNHWDKDSGKLRHIERLSSGKVVLLFISGSNSLKKPEITIEINYSGSLSKIERKEICNSVSHMFRLDENFQEFYDLCKQRGDQWKKLTRGLGRLLRSPSLFEDVVKTICTTNIQWGGTKRMIEELVSGYGEKFPGNPKLRAFPTPDAIAKVSLNSFSKKVKMGYRTEYVHLLTKQFATGEIGSESFFDPDIPTPELKKKLLEIKGIGNYAAATLLMLLGRYDELPTDTVFRDFVSKKYFNGRKVSDKKALNVYKRWGKWKYLAYWFELWEMYNEEEKKKAAANA